MATLIQYYLVLQLAAATSLDKKTCNFRLVAQRGNVECCFTTLRTESTHTPAAAV